MTLAEWMARHGVDDDSLAEMLGVDRSTVSRIRRGKQIPSKDTMAAIVGVTGGDVEPNAFFGLSEPENAAD